MIRAGDLDKCIDSTTGGIQRTWQVHWLHDRGHTTDLTSALTPWPGAYNGQQPSSATACAKTTALTTHFANITSIIDTADHAVFCQILIHVLKKEWCRRVGLQTSDRESFTKISQLDVCKLICLHKSFLLKYNNNKYLRTCKYLQKSLLVACEYT